MFGPRLEFRDTQDWGKHLKTIDVYNGIGSLGSGKGERFLWLGRLCGHMRNWKLQTHNEVQVTAEKDQIQEEYFLKRKSTS